MEREPEEDCDAEHCEKSIHALADFLGHGAFLFGSIAYGFLFHLLRGGWQPLLCRHENDNRNNHCGNRCKERVVDTGVKHIQVFAAELLHGLHAVISHGGCQCVKLVDILVGHRIRHAQELVAHSRERRIIDHAVDIKPPAAKHRGDERGNQAADIDEHIENLEA